MASVKSDGTQSATVTTEHTLLDTADAGVYQLIANLVNLANGDELELRVYDKVLSGDSYGVAWQASQAHAQGADGEITQSPPRYYPYGAKFTLKQTAGTGRSFKWAVHQY